MAIEFEISDVIYYPTEDLYDAWLDSGRHSDMTGAEAEVSGEPGGQFTAWDGYISGRNFELTPGRRILQAWRTVEFEDDDPDSTLEVLFEPVADGTRVTIRHSNLPPHGMQYRQGWVDNYFEPMKAYFEE